MCRPVAVQASPRELMLTFACTSEMDECLYDNGGCSGKCHNVPGSYLCSCAQGYMLDSGNRQCRDVDECNQGQGHCKQKCTNTDGSYYCGCFDGFKLGSDSYTCTREYYDAKHVILQLCLIHKVVTAFAKRFLLLRNDARIS